VKVYKLSERITGSVMERAAAFAYPGREPSLPPVLLVALPKSGSIYLQRALRRTLRVQTHHIGAAGMTGSTFGHYDLLRFERGNVVSREHLQPRAFSLAILAAHSIRKIVLHVRDPRAAIVSWTRHMDRVLENRGLRSVELSCELIMPEAYRDWSFEQRLSWQVENKMPGFVRWIEDWLQLVETSRDVKFLVTDFRALRDDASGLVARILDFYEIAYGPDWISMPVVRVGKNNIYTLPDAAASRPAWMTAMSAETLQAANANVPSCLLDRFDWVKV
jgi:hypothetical protein